MCIDDEFAAAANNDDDDYDNDVNLFICMTCCSIQFNTLKV